MFAFSCSAKAVSLRVGRNKEIQGQRIVHQKETYKLLFKRNLLELHAMDASRGRSKQRSSCKD